MTNPLLIPAIRQYRHNDDDGFVIGYDCGSVDQLVSDLQQANKKLEQERDQLKSDVSRLERKLCRMYDYDDMLSWRGIGREAGDEPCNVCSGSGVRSYGTTSTWRGGIGGCVITSDVCDRCWGSGVKDRPWTNLRQKAQENNNDQHK